MIVPWSDGVAFMEPVLGKTISRLLRSYYLCPDFPMKLRFWGWFRKLTNYARLTIPYAQMGWITVDERDLLQRRIFVEGTYETEVWATLAAFASEEVVWDIGAHIGSFAIQALLDCRVREIHCFEPDPEQAAILRFNLSLNGNNWRCHQVALGDRIEERLLFRGPQANTGLSTFQRDLGNGTVKVICLTGDEVISHGDAPPPTLVKIDVEGWEERVFQGARELLRTAPPKAIVFEASCDHTGELENKYIVSFLEKFGYQVSWIQRPNGQVQERENFLARYIG